MSLRSRKSSLAGCTGWFSLEQSVSSLRLAEPNFQGGGIPSREGRCWVPHRIDLETTQKLHQQLIASAETDPASYRKVSRHAAEVLADHGAKFEGNTAMGFALSALCLSPASMTALQQVAETLHEIVETALDWVFADSTRIEQSFTDHCRILPWIRKTRGLTTWQDVSRYDAVVTADGGIRILELNTGCPAGFMHAEEFSNVTQEAIHALSVGGGEVGAKLGFQPNRFGTIPGGALVEELLDIERKANVAPALIGLMNDENNLQNELELIARAFGRHGREAKIINAGEIQYENQQALWRGQPVSMMYNKIRISTANSPKHHWSPGFESRYSGFLEAIQNNAVVAVNNLAGLTVAEDKGLLELLRLPELASVLTPEQRQFVNEYVLWTARLLDHSVEWRGQIVDLLTYVRANREKFVIKPANEGRGFGVVVGKFATDEEWEAACQIDADMPRIVQEYAEPARLPVLRLQNENKLQVVDHHLTLALGMIQGRSRGVLSRISANPVTNVGREGIVQAVFLTES